MLKISDKKQLIDLLYNSGAITFLKSNNLQDVPYELKLQHLTSQPKILRFIAQLIGSEIKNESFDLIVGPYTDIPLATTVSLEYNWPMIFVRNERKKYGMEKLIEGNYQSDQRVVIVDEEIGDTANTLQLLGRLEGSNLNIVKLFVLVDLGNGAIEFIRIRGYKCEALITINDIFVHLLETGKITPAQLHQAKDYFESKKISSL